MPRFEGELSDGPKIHRGIDWSYCSAHDLSAGSGPAGHCRKILGLVGRWAPECLKIPYGNAPAPEYRFEIATDGRLVYSDKYSTSDVISAIAKSFETIVVSIHFVNPVDEIRILEIARRGSTIRVNLDRNDRYDYSIRDGRLLTTGTETRWAGKCS